MWRVWSSQGRINPADFLVPPKIYHGGLHQIRGNGIPKSCILVSICVPKCNLHRQTTSTGILGTLSSADDEARQIVNTVKESPQLSCIPCKQLVTRFIWTLSYITVYVRLQIHSVKLITRYMLKWQQHHFMFILLPRDNVHVPQLWQLGFLCHREHLSYCDTFSKSCHERINWWPDDHCTPRLLLHRLVNGFSILISMIIVIVLNHAEIDKSIFIMNIASAVHRAGIKRSSRNSLAPCCQDIYRWCMMSTIKLMEWLPEMWMNVE